MAAIKVVESGARAASARGLVFALPLYAIGIAGLLRDSWPGAPHLPGINLHAVFGVMLWLIVLAQYRDANLEAAPLRAAGLRELCRRLSRRIYLLLYVLFGISLLLRMAAILWNSGQAAALLPSPENLRDYLAYGVFALLTVRVLAAVQRQGLKGVVASQEPV